MTRAHADAPTLAAWSRRLARDLLAEDTPRRWAHVQGVAARAAELTVLVPTADRPVLEAAAWLHDIGYARSLSDTGFHPLDGARFLRGDGVEARVCALVARHSAAAAEAAVRGLTVQLQEFPDERTLCRDLLWYADATVGPDGVRVSFADRVAEIRKRHGSHSASVRSLPLALPERQAAVDRVERLLRR